MGNDSNAASGNPGKTTADQWKDLLTAVIAVSAVIVLLYVAPTILYHYVGYPTAEKWAKRIELPKPSASSVYQCPPSVAAAPVKPKPKGSKADAKLKPATTSASSAPVTPPCRPLTQVERDFLDQTEEWLVAVGNFHLEVAKDLFRWQYLATLSGLVAGALTGAALLVISLQGLPTATLWMKSVFVVCSATAAFWVAVPQLYRYSANQAAALKGYSLASSAIWQIRAVRAGNLDGDGKWIDGTRFVGLLPAKLAEISALTLAFDESKVGLPNLKTPGGS